MEKLRDGAPPGFDYTQLRLALVKLDKADMRRAIGLA